MPLRSYRWLLAVLAVVAFAADQATKYQMFRTLYAPGQVRGDREVADAQLSSLRSQLSSLRADIEQQIRSAMLDVTTADQLVHDATVGIGDLQVERYLQRHL